MCGVHERRLFRPLIAWTIRVAAICDSMPNAHAPCSRNDTQIRTNQRTDK